MSFDTTAGAPEAIRFDATTAAPRSLTCADCAGQIHAYYYEARGAVVCARCKQKLESVGASGSFGRALLYGGGAAAAGAALYYGVTKATGYEIGLVAGLVGFIVGAAVRAGAGGVGGRRYQWAAVLLTYFAIGAAYLPFAIQGVSSAIDKRATSSADSTRIVADAAVDTAAAKAGIPSPASAREPVAAATPRTKSRARHGAGAILAMGAFGLVIGALLMPILAVFMSLPGGLITGIIIFYGMRQAWRANAGTGATRGPGTITGPYRVGGAPAPVA